MLLYRTPTGSTYPFELLVRKTNAVLYADFVADAALFAQNGNALDFDALLDNAGGVATNGDRCALHTRPGTDSAAPADDGVHHAGIMADLRVFKDNRVLDTGPRSDNHARTNGDVRTKLSSRINTGGGVNVDWRYDGSGRRGKFFRLGLESLLEIESISWYGGASGLDLPPEILCLMYEEAVAVSQIGENVLLEAEDFALLGLLVVSSGDKRGLQIIRGRVGEKAWTGGSALDGAADGGEDALGSEQVNSAIDQVGDV